MSAANRVVLGSNSCKKPKPLGRKFQTHIGEAREVAARSIETCHKTKLDWVPTVAKDDRNTRGCRFGGECCVGAARRNDDCDATTNQVGCQLRQPTDLVARPAVFDGH